MAAATSRTLTRAPLHAVPEEAALRPGVGVVVLGDLSEVVVDVVLVLEVDDHHLAELCWGSRSTSRTLYPISLNATPRFSVVVVFATPPF